MKIQPVSLFKSNNISYKSSASCCQALKPMQNDAVILSKHKRKPANSNKIRTFEKRLNAFGINTTVDKNNKLVLSEYRQPAEGVTFEDIGINEDKLLKNVSTIKGNADFTDSKATSLGSVKVIEGDIILENHNLQDLGELAHVAGSRYCDDSNYLLKFELMYEIW